MLLIANKTSKNYTGFKIPDAVGIVFVVASVISGTIGIVFNLVDSVRFYFFSFIGILMSFAGLIDDLLGDDSSKGFKGHIKSLHHWKLTTGGLKAITGIITAIIISIRFSDDLCNFLINILLAALIINLINLFDTRPGRAVKGFFSSLFLMILSGAFHFNEYLFIVIGVIIAYMPIDLKEKGMMGDTGANFLGVILAASIIQGINKVSIRFFILVIAFLLNIVSEKYSFTEIIAKNRVLSLIDKFGTEK
jgi:UDP-N-acetylmuramyl pentapeptide phosphotransferase/UDP-N-acetylglucosamine-1-phosphate transferase